MNSHPILSKDWLTQIKASILNEAQTPYCHKSWYYVKSWLWLWSVFVEHTWSSIYPKHGRPNKLGFVCWEHFGGFVRCVENSINHRVEYRDPIDFVDHPSNMKIGLSWFQKGTNNKWTYNLMDHLMADLEAITAIASMTYFVDLDANELHLGDEKVFNSFINECHGFTLYIW